MFLPPLSHPLNTLFLLLLLLTTLTLPTITTTTTTTTTSHPSPSKRKTTTLDPYIICLSPPAYNTYPLISLPPFYTRAEYPTLTDLCSALNGARRNLGCVCHSAYSTVHCDVAVADPVLWDWNILPGGDRDGEGEGFEEHCRRDCYCASVRNAADARDADARWRGEGGVPMPLSTDVNTPWHFGPYHGHGGGGGGGEPGDDNSSSGNSAEDRNGDGDDNDGREVAPAHNGVAGAGAGAGGFQWENSCGKNCSTQQDCTAAAASQGQGGQGAQRQNCACVAAQSSQYQPGNGVMAFMATCIVSLATGSGGNGGKRALKGKGKEDPPCPCNGSYVSYACCGADNGVVWEREELKLGGLVGGWGGEVL